jgi:ArsR family transcriptional regulator, arsenate/arsenite/antimonite-responsive transcriptional repressor
MQPTLAIVKALDNEYRLRILLSLRDGEVCLCQLIKVLKLAPSTVSKHVDLLRQAGLVEMRKEGRWHHYRLAGRGASPAVREAIRWVTRSLEDDQLIAADAARLSGVRKSAPEEWTACYSRS